MLVTYNLLFLIKEIPEEWRRVKFLLLPAEESKKSKNPTRVSLPIPIGILKTNLYIKFQFLLREILKENIKPETAFNTFLFFFSSTRKFKDRKDYIQSSFFDQAKNRNEKLDLEVLILSADYIFSTNRKINKKNRNHGAELNFLFLHHGIDHGEMEIKD